MPWPISAELSAEIVRLHKEGVAEKDIATRFGISHRTVRVYVSREEYGTRFKIGILHGRLREPANPLYDPVRDGNPEQSLTSQLMGDPLPGRRQMVAAHKPHKSYEKWGDHWDNLL